MVKRAPDGNRAFVAFDEGQEQDMMLNAAWADSHEVPQRKHRRYPTGNKVLYNRRASRRRRTRAKSSTSAPAAAACAGRTSIRSARACASSRSGSSSTGRCAGPRAGARWGSSSRSRPSWCRRFWTTFADGDLDDVADGDAGALAQRLVDDDEEASPALADPAVERRAVDGAA